MEKAVALSNNVEPSLITKKSPETHKNQVFEDNKNLEIVDESISSRIDTHDYFSIESSFSINNIPKA